jgi:hypothetical protein
LTAETRSCIECGGVTAAGDEKCPSCGHELRSSGKVRRLGWVQLALGVFITGLMGTVTYRVAPMMLRPGEETAGGARFTGTAEQSLLIFGIFGLVITFGLMAIVSVLYQIKTGRRNKWIFVLMLGLFVVLVVASWVIRAALGGRS